MQHDQAIRINLLHDKHRAFAVTITMLLLLIGVSIIIAIIVKRNSIDAIKLAIYLWIFAALH